MQIVEAKRAGKPAARVPCSKAKHACTLVPERENEASGMAEMGDPARVESIGTRIMENSSQQPPFKPLA